MERHTPDLAGAVSPEVATKRIALALTLAGVAACTSPDQTFFIYRRPYEDGTDVLVWQDHLDADVEQCTNNYVWIQHPGDEWSKYSHVATGTVTGAPPFGGGLEEGDAVVAGPHQPR